MLLSPLAKKIGQLEGELGFKTVTIWTDKEIDHLHIHSPSFTHLNTHIHVLVLNLTASEILEAHAEISRKPPPISCGIRDEDDKTLVRLTVTASHQHCDIKPSFIIILNY
jgi:hypothetical protein